MFLGLIKRKGIDYHLKLNKTNNLNELSFIKVSNNGISSLEYEQAKNLLKEVFTSELTFKTAYNGYDIYLDNNHYMRFFKDNKEDFKLFYKNNGAEATDYNSTHPVKSIIKVFSFVAAGVTSLLFVNPQGISVIQNFDSLEQQGITYVDDVNLDYYAQVDLSRIKEYIVCSEGLSQEDKKTIYNEDLINKALEYSSESRLLYDFNDRFKDINIKDYPTEVNPGTDGFYDCSNTLHILDSITPESKRYKPTVIHEFIHLLQVPSEYNYIKEGCTEILSIEYFDVSWEDIGYKRQVKTLRYLMEIIGPEPIMKLCFSENGSIAFEEEIKKLLDEKDATEFLSLLKGYDFCDPEKGEDINNKVYEYIRQMYYNKNGYVMSEQFSDTITNPEITPNRFYFYDTREEFYNPIKFSILDKDIRFLVYSKEKYNELMKNEEFRKFTELFEETAFVELVWDEKEMSYFAAKFLSEEQIKSGEYNYEVTIKHSKKIDNFDMYNEFYLASKNADIDLSLDKCKYYTYTRRMGKTLNEESYRQNSIYVPSVYEKFYKGLEIDKDEQDTTKDNDDLDIERN